MSLLTHTDSVGNAIEKYTRFRLTSTDAALLPGRATVKKQRNSVSPSKSCEFVFTELEREWCHNLESVLMALRPLVYKCRCHANANSPLQNGLSYLHEQFLKKKKESMQFHSRMPFMVIHLRMAITVSPCLRNERHVCRHCGSDMGGVTRGPLVWFWHRHALKWHFLSCWKHRKPILELKFMEKRNTKCLLCQWSGKNNTKNSRQQITAGFGWQRKQRGKHFLFSYPIMLLPASN